jgi:ABC-type nickel/cobalt efflux system permease component RcnA
MLVLDGVSNADASQTARVASGALVASLGLFSIWSGTRKSLELRKYYTNDGG